MAKQPLITATVIRSSDLGVAIDRQNKEYAERIYRALDAAGLIVQNAARKSVTDGPKTGRIYKRGTVTHRASAPGEPPASDTGRLVSTIVYRVLRDEQATEITAGTEYAPHLEFGTRTMEARPFMNPALQNNMDKVRAVMRAILSTQIGPRNAR